MFNLLISRPTTGSERKKEKKVFKYIPLKKKEVGIEICQEKNNTEREGIHHSSVSLNGLERH